MPAPIQLDYEQFKEPGLYLLFDDGLFLTLTRDVIERTRKRYLLDPQLLPLSVRAAPSYAPCTICPKRDTAVICHAIPTVFPFLEEADRFLSCDRALAIFRSEPSELHWGESVLHVARASMQRALQHVSILSLMYYCEIGRAYFKYFAGIIPLTHPMGIVEQVYLNIYWDLRGDLPAIRALIAKMRKELDVTVECQLERLRLICRSDAFLNAFINTHVATQFLQGDMEAHMRRLFDARNASGAEPDLD